MNTIIHKTIHCKVVSFIICILLSSTFLNAQSRKVEIIELRNYLLRPGQRDYFIDSLEIKIIDTLNARGNYVLGQYRIKDAPDNFLWIRGFNDMTSRLEALNGFYSSEYWKKHVSIPRKYVVGYTNVSNRKVDSTAGFEMDWFGRQKGLAVVDFYVANEMRTQLVDFVSTFYDSAMRASGVKDVSYWISESTPNDYPNLPVFQDKNLLVTITFFKDELQYNNTKKKIEKSMNEEQKFRMNRIITTKTTWVLFPTKKSFSNKVK
jgi:hypothetical protein